MNWFTSLFSGNSPSSRKGQTLHSTHEAFSLPTSSPVFASHPETPDPETATTASFAYPPSSAGSYGYIPTSGGSHSRPSSLLPMHHDAFHTPLAPTSSYPPLASSWNRIKAWLSREYPELGDTLNYGILPQDLANIEMQFGFPLPAVVRESYLIVDGQEPESSAGCSEGLFFGLTLLPLEDVYEEWKFWREVDEDPSTGANEKLREAMQSLPPKWIRREYSQRGWIPLIADKAGNYVGVDINPDEGGQPGQVIVFGRDFDTKVVLFNGDGPTGWAKWLASFADELESGEGFDVGATEGGDGSEDEIGYESYYYDGSGVTGDGGGDGSSGGGLRLNGEYRGWNVFEAWADRSVRKWFDNGVITQTDEENGEDSGKGKAPEKIPLEALDISDSRAAEVPIPVVGDASKAYATPVSSTNNVAKRHPTLPAISVTKPEPPVPLPVELPTPRDIVSLPSPPDSTHSSFDGDLEAGRGRGLRQLPSSDQETALVSELHSRQNSEAEPVPLLPASPPQSLARMSPPPETTELLVDPAPTAVAQPLEPGPLSTQATPSDNQELLDLGNTSTNDVSIRLVGAPPDEFGVVESAGRPGSASDDVDSDANSIASRGPSEPITGKPKKHKKTMSGLSGLKKSFGGLRKKDSVSISDSN